MTNVVVKKEGGYLSYLGTEGRDALSVAFDQMLGVPCVEETAFVLEGEGHMAILEGDWREACSELESMEECLKVFWDNVEKATVTSQHTSFKNKPSLN